MATTSNKTEHATASAIQSNPNPSAKPTAIPNPEPEPETKQISIEDYLKLVIESSYIKGIVVPTNLEQFCKDNNLNPTESALVQAGFNTALKGMETHIENLKNQLIKKEDKENATE